MILDLHRRLDPHGRFTPVIGGIQARMSDGIHLTPAGAKLVAPWILDAARRAGLTARQQG